MVSFVGWFHFILQSNNNRNKVHSKYDAFESPRKHPPSLWKNCLPWDPSLVPKKVGDRWVRELSPGHRCVEESWFCLDSWTQGQWVQLTPFYKVHRTKHHKGPLMEGDRHKVLAQQLACLYLLRCGYPAADLAGASAGWDPHLLALHS